MTHTDYTKNILNIKDKNIYFYENCLEERIIKGTTTKVFTGFLTYKAEYCPHCGCTNESAKDIIRWGWRKNCKIKINKVSEYNTLLILNKQRFFCKHCNNTFIAETNIVNRNCNISFNSNLAVSKELMSKSSEKDIASRQNISVSSVNRILDNISNHSVLHHPSLPTEMNWDEFKCTKDTDSKMAFIITDNKNHTIFDILSSRKSLDLDKFFRRYPKSNRNKVKLISVDMYNPYIVLARNLFKNANIVIDRFYVVAQVYKALNITRIKLCKKSNPNYKKLKHYWKLILKNENKLNENDKYYSRFFRKNISEKKIVTYLINTNKTLKATYECYQGIINSIEERNINKFTSIIKNVDKNVSMEMKKSMKTYKNFLPYIKNSFIYDINNGVIEGTNNYIKVIKRISFDYRSFKHFRARILLTKGIIKYNIQKDQKFTFLTS